MQFISDLINPVAVSEISSLVLRIAIVLVSAQLLLRFSAYLIDRVFIPAAESKRVKMEEKKAKTLSALVKSIVNYAIFFIVIIIMLDIFGIQTAPIIASAGILGLAVGFGAQSLVKDVITGFFIILEQQFSVGDYIKAAGVDGVVEELGFRTTKIRDFGGELHIIPNGLIDKVTNYVTGNMRVLVTVQIAYKENIDEVLNVLSDMCATAAEEIESIAEGPRVLGVTELADSGVKILLWAKTAPMEQWGVSREITKRAKLALDEAGIEIPFPHMVIVGNEKPVSIDVNTDKQE